MKKILLLTALLVTATAAFALETFDSVIAAKETAQVFGNGALSGQDSVFVIVVKNGDQTMKVEVQEPVYEALVLGDLVRISFEKGLFGTEIKSIRLLRKAK